MANMSLMSPRGKMMKKSILCVLILVCFSVLAHGEQGVILKLKGTARVLKVKTFQLQDAQAGMLLDTGDVVKTDEGTLLHLSLPGGRIALIKEKSRFKIMADQQQQHVSLEFDQGEFLVGVKRKLPKEESFRVISPSVVVGVRGTLFWGKVDERLTSTYACFESQVTILAGGIMLALRPGEKVSVPYGQVPSAVEAANIPLSYLDTFEIDKSLQGLKDLLK